MGEGVAAGPLPAPVPLVAPPAWQAIDFISDLHLSETMPATFAAFADHLQHTAADAVFVLGDLFEPLEMNAGDLRTRKTRVAGDGSSMLVPMPVLGSSEATPPHSVLIRFAQRGRRLFTLDAMHCQKNL